MKRTNAENSKPLKEEEAGAQVVLIHRVVISVTDSVRGDDRSLALSQTRVSS